jgi:hypothetical protein
MVVELIVLVTGLLTLLGTQLFMARMLHEMRRESQESLQALMHGQEHIAELTAEVLRRIQ